MKYGQSPLLFSWLAILAVLVTSTACQPTEGLSDPSVTPTHVPGVLYVDMKQELGTINPNVYGANYGPWVAVPPDLLPQAIDSGVTLLRYPGGAWGDRNDLQESHFKWLMILAEQMNAEVFINVRLLDGSPEKAADLVRLANIEHEYNIRYWGIGNEPSLFADYTTERFNQEWREIAEAMLEVDPEIILIGPETHQYTGNPTVDPKDPNGKDWVREFLLANGDLVDIVAIHRYPFPTSMTGPKQTIDDLRNNSREWDSIIPNLRALILETTGKDLPIAVTEVSSDWSHAISGEATPDSFYNAIWWADSLGRMIKHDVDMVTYFLLSCKSSAGGWGLLAGFDVRPTYYVYQMYQHFGDELVYSSSDDQDLSIYAARREDDSLTLMVINLGPEDKQVPLVLDNLKTAGEAEVWLFDQDHQAEQVSTLSITDEMALELPAQSISLYIIPIR